MDDWNNLEKNNLAIALNVFYAKKEKIYPTYFSTSPKARKASFSFNDSKWRRGNILQ